MNDDQKITTEDKELADMIAGLNAGASAAATMPTPPPPPAPPTPPVAQPSVQDAGPADFVRPITPSPVVDPVPPTAPPVARPPAPLSLDPAQPDNSLDFVKKDVLNELRPLVDKLDLPPEEKFDTLLLLIRSTDDKNLILPAHEAAKAIPDESRRAAALIDIIKEIDFFENPN